MVSILHSFQLIFLFYSFHLIEQNCEIKVEPIGTIKTRVGEGPFFDSITNSLYFTDIIGKDQILRYDLSENQIYKAHIKGETGQMGFIIPVEGRKNLFGCGIGEKLVIVRWDGVTSEAESLGTQLVLGPSTNVVHDGLVDPWDNLFAGTVRSVLCNPNSTNPSGGLYRSRNGQRVTEIISGMNAPNGFAIDDIKCVLYLIDSCNKHIRVYDYQPVTGILCKYFSIKNAYIFQFDNWLCIRSLQIYSQRTYFDRSLDASNSRCKHSVCA